MNDKKYHKLDPYIHRISSRFKLKEDSMKKANERLTEVLEHFLLPVMKEVDANFKELFQRVHYSGSYYENLRICEANEFDLNLELKSRTKGVKCLKVCSSGHHPGFVQIQHQSGAVNGKWVNGNGHVLQTKVLDWLKSVVDRALASPKIKNGPWYKLSQKTSGPAVTLIVEYDIGNVFTVDLVPVFVFTGSDDWPQYPVRQSVINSETPEWCVVPKPNSFLDDNGIAGTFWRMSFYSQEKEILNDKNHLKNALKLMKLLRDKEGWHCLASYYLKTLYLWIVMENDSKFWEVSIGVVFMNMLRILKDYLRDRGGIPFFWDERYNLLSAVNPIEIMKIGNRIEKLIKDIDRHIDNNDAEYIETLFETSERTASADGGALVLAPTQPESSVNLIELSLGIGALAVGGVLLYRAFTNRRDD